MANPQPSAQWWVIEYVDWDKYIAVTHFFREKDKAIAKFEELCDIVREYTECPDVWDTTWVPADYEGYEYEAWNTFRYHNGDDEYYHYAVVRIQANTSIDLHY